MVHAENKVHPHGGDDEDPLFTLNVISEPPKFKSMMEGSALTEKYYDFIGHFTYSNFKSTARWFLESFSVDVKLSV